MAQSTIIYDQARDALVDGEPARALELWERVCAVDPHYLDSQDVQGRARDMLDRQEAGRRRKGLWAIIGLVGGALLILAVLLASGIFSNSPQETDAPALSPEAVAPLATTFQPEEPTYTSLNQAHDTPSPTMTMTLIPTYTATASPTMTPTPTPTGALGLATAVEPSSIFQAPSSSSRELGVVEVGEQVVVLGRSDAGGWFYVRDEQGVEGFAYAPRFGWEGDFEALPVQESNFTPPPPPTRTPTPPPAGSYPPLSIDFWQLPGTERCEAQVWRQSVWIQGQGGDGTYTYYRDGEFLAGPLNNEGYSFEVSSSAGAIIITGRVVSGDGQEVQKEIYVPRPACD
jgi:hypothetical protein